MFEWDEAKRLANIAKHGIDFVIVGDVFDGRPVVHFAVQSLGEDRTLSIAFIEGQCVSTIWTWRGEAVRIISMRRASRDERKSYRTHFG